MKLQTIDIQGAICAIVPLRDYDALHEALEDAADAEALRLGRAEESGCTTVLWQWRWTYAMKHGAVLRATAAFAYEKTCRTSMRARRPRSRCGVRLPKICRTPEESIPMSMADRLRQTNPVRVWREHRGITATELATAAGISKSQLSAIENGESCGSVATLRRVANVLQLTVDDLLI